MTAVLPPALPAGRFVDLPGRGTAWVRELGPNDAPALLLLHGWSVTADLNWWTAYQALAADHRVIALDHRGHSDGIRDDRPFTLEDCADDAAALCDALGIRRAVPVGYSMGGAVAQLLWQRHRDLVDGLVLCATSRSFRGRPKDRTLLGLLNVASPGARRLTPEQRAMVMIRLLNGRRTDQELRERAADALRRHDWLRVLEAGQAIFRFDSRPWADQIDVPAGVVVTSHDRVVPTGRQLQLATAIPDATVHVVDGDHGAAANPDTFLPQLLNACRSVVDRIAASTAAAAVSTASA